MALLRVPDRDPLVLGRAIAEVFAATPDTRLSLYRDAVAEHQRFDLVAEAYGDRGQGGEMAARLERAIAGAVDPNQSAVGIYRKALALPLPPPTL